MMKDSREKYVKQCYGKDVMARIISKRNLDFEGILLIRDCGFQIEVDPLEEWVGVENLYMVNLFREGCDFTNDSREYVHTNGKMHQVYNDRSEEHTSELQSLMRISYAVFCLKKKTITFSFYIFFLYFSILFFIFLFYFFLFFHFYTFLIYFYY